MAVICSAILVATTPATTARLHWHDIGCSGTSTPSGLLVTVVTPTAIVLNAFTIAHIRLPQHASSHRRHTDSIFTLTTSSRLLDSIIIGISQLQFRTTAQKCMVLTAVPSQWHVQAQHASRSLHHPSTSSKQHRAFLPQLRRVRLQLQQRKPAKKDAVWVE